MRVFTRTTSLVLASCVLLLTGSTIVACPFCPAPEPALSERLALAEAVALARWIETPGSKGKSTVPSRVAFSVITVTRAGGGVAVDRTISLDRPKTGQPGDLFLLTGVKQRTFQWDTPVVMTPAAFRYVNEAPARDLPAARRLPYYLEHLEHPDSIVANDAFSEFAAAAYSDVKPVAPRFSAEKLKNWIARQETQQTRVGFYGMMLGLCGTKTDAEFLKTEIDKPAEAYRLGLDGMMAGYVLLTGDEGVALLEDRIRQRPNNDRFTEAYASMQTLRFLWQYAPERASRTRLQRAMRFAIERPELADLAIKDLTRWEDWELMPWLVGYYDSPGENAALKRRAIAQYLIALSQKRAPQNDAVLATQIETAKKHLDELKAKDPKVLSDAKKYFF
ncbi:hypothetical protein Pan44_46240 [Caulifigura coniformis]|uniref:Uncharacterized protein n=1 Tax=Caulifigura coniformis TaxID=2527983 RepID=A0A517SKC4_9PLAN|nr:hypothetical protein [Caulifigura coniformis]QDT56568.1 hypothetical protein Pan44_46240 [Caulifigura coniformis]